MKEVPKTGSFQKKNMCFLSFSCGFLLLFGSEFGRLLYVVQLEARCPKSMMSDERDEIATVTPSRTVIIQWLFLVPVKGGRWHIIPQLAIYTTYIPLIYCLLWGYMLPTIFYGNQKQPLNHWFTKLGNKKT